MTEAIEKAENQFALVRKVLGSSKPEHEGKYADAYQQLVRLGVRPQLRKRYR